MKTDGLKVKITRLIKNDAVQEAPHKRQKSDFKSAFYISLTVFSVIAAVVCVLITDVVRF